jgi:two-component system phosphate regulon response regulator PhoB
MHTVLIGDDDPNLRLLINLTLDTPEFEVIEAVNGRDVLRVLEEKHVDLIVLDWMMPGMTGIEVVRELRALPETASVPIVMLSARTRDGDLLQAMEAGVQHYLIKPFSPIELLETVERALSATLAASHAWRIEEPMAIRQPLN